MKKIMSWTLVISIIVFMIDWGVVGLKLLNGDYDITVGAYIGLVCILVIWISVFYRIFSDKCPHCGKVRLSNGEYCSYCGKKVK